MSKWQYLRTRVQVPPPPPMTKSYFYILYASDIIIITPDLGLKVYRQYVSFSVYFISLNKASKEKTFKIKNVHY